MSEPAVAAQSASSDATTDYQVRIRSANQKVDDYVISCRPNWSVLNLKEHISRTHVNKPNVEGQRLIYAGNVLKDASTLEQIFFRDSLCTELTNFNKKDFTIHMVSQMKPVPRSSPVAGASSSSTSTPGTGPQPTLAGNNPTSTAAGSTPTPAAGNPSQPFNPLNLLGGTTFTFAATHNPNASAADQQQYIRNFMQSDQMRQQMATFQQLACLVATQIANNMALASQGATRINLVDTQASQPTNPASPVSASSLSGPALNHIQINSQVSSSSSSQNPNENPPNVVPQLVEARQVGFGAQIQAQAQAAYLPNPPQPEVNAAPMHQHDVIDWAYYSVRAFLFIVALYIHASMFRLLFIMGLLLVAYFLNRRSGRRNAQHHARHQQQQQQNRQNAAAAAPAAAAGPDEAGELRRRNVDGLANNNHNINNNNNNADAQGESQDRAQNPPAPNRLPFLKLCYLVVADFLTSLLPQ